MSKNGDKIAQYMLFSLSMVFMKELFQNWETVLWLGKFYMFKEFFYTFVPKEDM